MKDGEGLADGVVGAGGVVGRAISLAEASRIAGEVGEMIRAGHGQSAWEMIRHLHPADMGSIVAGLPRASRDVMLRVMSPETVVWMLRQMNPVEAGRVGTRLGTQALTFVLGQVHPLQALATLRRLSLLRVHGVGGPPGQPLEEELLAEAPGTAESLMVSQLPTVGIDERAEMARESLKALGMRGTSSLTWW